MSQVNAEYEHYQRIKLLGEGSFGKAYLVKCLSDDSQCVIKQVDLSGMDEKEMRDTLNEAKILEVLGHPNIVKFREVYKTKKGKLCIVMDYADGGDLTARIKAQNGKHFSENQILDWFTQICLGLKHVHDRKILHRDLKAQNVFLTKSSIIKLGDFGIARVLSGTQEHAKTMVGTPYYLSPEIINGKPYNFKSDIWSLGVLLYELCALKPPFDAKNLPFLALKIVKGQYSPIPITYSKGLKDLVNSLFKVNPKERPNINAILNTPIIQDRIRKYLSETTHFREFSKTFLKNQNFSLNDLKLEDIRHIENDQPMPAHVLKALKEKEREKENLLSHQNQAEQSPANLRPPGQSPSHSEHPNQPSFSPALKPIMHYRKSPSNSPMMQAGRPLEVQQPSPLTRLRQLGPSNRADPHILPPVHSPQLNAGGRSPAQVNLMASVGNLKPLMESKDRINCISAQNFLNPKGEQYSKESPQTNMPRALREKNHHSENKEQGAYSPSVQLPALNRNKVISQSPNLGPLVAKPRQLEGGFPLLTKPSGTPASEPGKRSPCRIVVKREALKGFERVSPRGDPIVVRNIEREFSPRPLMSQESLSGYKENQKDQFDSDDEIEKLTAAVAQKGESRTKIEQDDDLVVKGQRLRFHSGADEEILCHAREGKSGESTPNIKLIAPPINLEAEVKDHSSPILTRKPRSRTELTRSRELPTEESNFGKITIKELQDMESMALELNNIITDLEADVNTNNDAPYYNEGMQGHENPILTRNERRYEDREDDPNEMQLNDKENQKKSDMESPFEFKGNQDMRKKLESAMGHEKFNATYLIVKDLVAKHEDTTFDEEKSEHYAKVFPFLSKDEIDKYLFNIFTFVVMEGWINSRRC